MGIRIHKTMGYGFYGLGGEPSIFKPHFSDYLAAQNIPKFMDWIATPDGFAKACEVIAKVDGEEVSPTPTYDTGIDLTFLINEKPKNDFVHCYSGEFDEKNGDVVLFAPLREGDWHRYDDLMDHYDSDGGSVVKVLENGIFPYDFNVKIPGAPICFEENPSDDALILKQRLFGAELSMLKKIPKTKDYLAKYYRPKIPGDIVAAIYFMDLLVDFDTTIQTMRPILYTCWC